MSTGLSDLKVTHWRPLTHQLSFCEMGPHPVVFPCHVLGRAGTCHLFFFFFFLQSSFSLWSWDCLLLACSTTIIYRGGAPGQTPLISLLLQLE